MFQHFCRRRSVSDLMLNIGTPPAGHATRKFSMEDLTTPLSANDASHGGITTTTATFRSPAVSAKSILLAEYSPLLEIQAIDMKFFDHAVKANILHSDFANCEQPSKDVRVRKPQESLRTSKRSKFDITLDNLTLRFDTMVDYYLLLSRYEANWAALSQPPTEHLLKEAIIRIEYEFVDIEPTTADSYYRLLDNRKTDFSVLNKIEPIWTGLEETTLLQYYNFQLVEPNFTLEYPKLPRIVPVTLEIDFQKSLQVYLDNLQELSAVGSFNDQFLALRQARYFIILLNDQIFQIDSQRDQLEKKTAYLERKYQLFLSMETKRSLFEASLEEHIGGVLGCLLRKNMIKINEKNLSLLVQLVGSMIYLFKECYSAVLCKKLNELLEKCREFCLGRLQDLNFGGYYHEYQKYRQFLKSLFFFQNILDSDNDDLNFKSRCFSYNLNLVDFKSLLQTIRGNPHFVKGLLQKIQNHLRKGIIFIQLKKNHLLPSNYLTAELYTSTIDSFSYYNQKTIYPLEKSRVCSRQDVLDSGALIKKAFHGSLQKFSLSEKALEQSQEKYKFILTAMKNLMGHFNTYTWPMTSYYKKVPLQVLISSGAILDTSTLEDFQIEQAYIAIDTGGEASQKIQRDLLKLQDKISKQNSLNNLNTSTIAAGSKQRTKFRLIFGYENRLEPVFISQYFKLDTVIYDAFEAALLGSYTSITLSNFVTLDPHKLLDACLKIV